MKRRRLHRHYAAVWLLLLGLPAASDANAFGEVFRIEVTGNEYCGDFISVKLKPASAIPLWGRVDGPTQLTVSLTPDFQAGTIFPLFGFFYVVKAGKAALIASVDFEGGAYMTIQGEVQFDKNTAAIKSVKGIFVQSGVFTDECFSQGKFKTSKP